MKKYLLFSSFCISPFLVPAQNVGIGTLAPKARLHIADSSVVFTAGSTVPGTAGNPPVTGEGRRMMWYADKAAFRSGYVGADQWDKPNIGIYSFAAGYETLASGPYSTAFGLNAQAAGMRSFATGNQTNASGQNAVAMGYGTQASGLSATAMGYSTIATGSYSTAMGFESIATGAASTAMGYISYAPGEYASSIGFRVVANGDYSNVIGSYVSTNFHEGSFLIGDHSTTTTMMSPSDNNFRARFANGYRFYTSANLSTGCSLQPGDNAWATTSDARLKENFETINGELILKKIAAFKLGSWNYIGQVNTFRHYGPMAQDFFAAFGKDSYGAIGSDTTINQADFDGVNLIAIQALEKRTAGLQKENEELRKTNKNLEARLLHLEALVTKKMK